MSYSLFGCIMRAGDC